MKGESSPTTRGVINVLFGCPIEVGTKWINVVQIARDGKIIITVPVEVQIEELGISFVSPNAVFQNCFRVRGKKSAAINRTRETNVIGNRRGHGIGGKLSETSYLNYMMNINILTENVFCKNIGLVFSQYQYLVERIPNYRDLSGIKFRIHSLGRAASLKSGDSPLTRQEKLVSAKKIWYWGSDVGQPRPVYTPDKESLVYSWLLEKIER